MSIQDTQTLLDTRNQFVGEPRLNLTSSDFKKFASSTRCRDNGSSVVSALRSFNAHDCSAPHWERMQTAGDSVHDTIEDIEAIKLDVQKGDGWTERSIVAWARLFVEATSESGASVASVKDQMNALGALFNNATKTERVGMAAMDSEYGTRFYMLLSRDPEALGKNHQTLIQGKESATVIDIGTFFARCS